MRAYSPASNCFAGGLDAVLAYPNSTAMLKGDENGVKLMWLVLGLYALVTLAIIALDIQKWLNIGLGLLTIAMIALFSRILSLMIEQGKVDGLE